MVLHGKINVGNSVHLQMIFDAAQATIKLYEFTLWTKITKCVQTPCFLLSLESTIFCMVVKIVSSWC